MDYYESLWDPAMCVEYDESKKPIVLARDENGLLKSASHAAFLWVPNGWTVSDWPAVGVPPEEAAQ